jgi:hypothetical protein
MSIAKLVGILRQKTLGVEVAAARSFHGAGLLLDWRQRMFSGGRLAALARESTRRADDL